MRRPTKPDELLAWYRRAIANAQLPEHARERLPVTMEPQCGWFRRRLIRGGPWVPARIWVEIHDQPVDAAGELVADEVLLWRCTVNGVEKEAEDEWPILCGRPITEDEFEFLSGLERYATKHDQREPLANPKAPIDIGRAPPPIFRRKRRT